MTHEEQVKALAYELYAWFDPSIHNPTRLAGWILDREKDMIPRSAILPEGITVGDLQRIESQLLDETGPLMIPLDECATVLTHLLALLAPGGEGGGAGMPAKLRCPDCHGHDLAVMQRNERCSAFDGYRVMYSPRSRVKCLDCGRQWRTYAIVHSIPDAKGARSDG